MWLPFDERKADLSECDNQPRCRDAGRLPAHGLVHLAVPALTCERPIRIRLPDFSGFAPMGAAKARRQMAAEQGCHSAIVYLPRTYRRVSALPSGAVQPMLV